MLVMVSVAAPVDDDADPSTALDVGSKNRRKKKTKKGKERFMMTGKEGDADCSGFGMTFSVANRI